MSASGRAAARKARRGHARALLAAVKREAELERTAVRSAASGARGGGPPGGGRVPSVDWRRPDPRGRCGRPPQHAGAAPLVPRAAASVGEPEDARSGCFEAGQEEAAVAGRHRLAPRHGSLPAMARASMASSLACSV
ncbi:hypothetical protein PVAP13_1KG272105 [Panicum virgatum]|uniref:Uncharacterized protein n=1 Tax=Panicum virgatum TaxID=38727 RepID=A0A8T0XL39_PANVG|nr:hypothetical protein PVAP13_1KG272105 [Panicum virgatum]